MEFICNSYVVNGEWVLISKLILTYFFTTTTQRNKEFKTSLFFEG